MTLYPNLTYAQVFYARDKEEVEEKENKVLAYAHSIGLNCPQTIHKDVQYYDYLPKDWLRVYILVQGDLELDIEKEYNLKVIRGKEGYGFY